MKLRMPMLGILMCLLMVPISSRAQDQANKLNDEIRHLRVDIVLTEYNGDKKIDSLPYTIYVASWHQWRRGTSKVRMGVRVPIATGSMTGSNSQFVNTQFTYQDVGTNIDCSATTLDNGSYDLGIFVTRSSIYAPAQEQSESKEVRTVPGQPVIRNFNSDFDISLRDGETKQGTSATDPLNGNVLKISVTLHVMQ